MRPVALLTVLSACSEPSVVTTLVLPAEHLDYNLSCVTSIDVYVYGETYPADPEDRRIDCIPIENRATFADVRAAARGQLDLALPDTGLQAIEIDGRTGPCDLEYTEDADLKFRAGAMYDGSGRIDVQMIPVATCSTIPRSARVLDLLQLIQTRDCTAALLPDAPDQTDRLHFGVMTGSLFGGALFYSSYGGPSLTAGVVTANAPASVDANSCLAAYAGTDDDYSLSCMQVATPLCAQPGEFDIGVVNDAAVWPSFDNNKLVEWNYGVSIISVWTNAPAKAPLAGATVTIDPDLGEVVYVESNGVTLVPTPNATATGASGLAVVYSDVVTDVTVNSPRGARKVRIGSDGESAVAFVVF